MLEFISIMRAIAVVLVVAYHLNIPWFENGYLGVDIFLVIAGYFVGEAFFGKRYSFGYFVDRRIRRLLPELLFWGLIFILFYSLFARNGDVINAYIDLAASLFFISNMYYETFIGYFESNSAELLFLHTWSLSLEVQFYVIFALGYVIFLKHMSRELVFIAIILGFIVSLLLNEWAYIYAPSPAFYYLPTRLWEFLVGVGIAFVAVHKVNVTRMPWIIILACSAAAFAIFITDGTEKNLITVIFSGVGLAIALNTKNHPNFQSIYVSPIILVGEKSYSLYLIHWPLIKIFEAIGYPVESNMLAVFFLILIVATQFSDKYISAQFSKTAKTHG